MPDSRYTYSNLNQAQLEKIKDVESEINKKTDDEVILLAINKKV